MAREIASDLIVMGTHGRTGMRSLLAGSVAIAVMRRAHCPVLALRSPEVPREAKEIRMILHPTDFSVDSEAVLRVARSLARDLGARLVILHVAPLDILSSGTMTAPVDPRVYNDLLEDVRKRVDGPDLKNRVETEFTRGDAAAEILRAASELGSDLIVMGTHGRTGLSRLLMGSVAEFVLPRASCPVLVVKSAQQTAAATQERRADKFVSVY
jgi:nucleotide-binding universal stress UspA family protein